MSTFELAAGDPCLRCRLASEGGERALLSAGRFLGIFLSPWRLGKVSFTRGMVTTSWGREGRGEGGREGRLRVVTICSL